MSTLSTRHWTLVPEAEFLDSLHVDPQPADLHVDLQDLHVDLTDLHVDP